MGTTAPDRYPPDAGSGSATAGDAGGPVFLGAAPATRADRRRAMVVAGLLIAAFAFTSPWAGVPLRPAPAFAVVYNAAVIVVDLITAFLLYAQFRQLRERSFLALVCGYLFTPLLVTAHTLSFPNAFGPGSLIGGDQTTAWLWMGWHGLFPAFVAGYALLARRERDGAAAPPPGSRAATVAVSGTVALAAAATLLATAADRLLPELMLGDDYRSLQTQLVLAGGWFGHLAALAVLVWATRLRRLIDLWIAVALVALLIDLALSAVLVSGRYQIGWFLGRVYGFLGASFVLAVLLRQSVALYGGAVAAAERLRESETKYRTLFEAIDEGFALFEMMYDPDGTPVDFRYVETNRAFERQAGRRPRPGQTMREVFPEAEDMWLAVYAEVARTRRPKRFSGRVAGLDRWFDVYVFPAAGPPGRLAALFRDVTAEKRAEAALRESESLLAGQKEAFEAAVNGRSLVEALGILRDTAVKHAGEGGQCGFYLSDHGTKRLWHVAGMSDEFRACGDGVPIGADQPGCGLAVHTGEPVITPDALASVRWGPWRWLAEQFHFRGVWSFPLKATGGRVVGSFAMYFKDVRDATPRDHAFASVIAKAAAIIISRHQQAQERERAEAALRASEERQAFLLKLSDALRPLADPEQITTTAALVLGEQLGLNRAFYAVVGGEDWVLVRAHETGVVPLPAGRYPIASYGQWLLDLMRAGERLVVPDIAADPRYTPAQREGAKAFQVVSEAAVPLVKDGQLLALFVVHSAVARQWSEHEVGLISETAERTWAAVERAKAEAALRESAAKLGAVFETMIEACCIFEMIYDDLGKPVDWRILEANPGYERESGLKDVAGKLAGEVMPGTEPYWIETFARVVETGEAQQIEKWHQPTGRWIHSSTARVGGPGSKRLVSVFYDVTERKRAELALKASEERQAFLLKLSDALRAESDADAVVNRALRMLAEQLRLDRCFVGVNRFEDDRGDLTRQVANDAVPPLPADVRLSDFPEALRVTFGRTLVIDNLAEAEGLTDADRRSLGALGLRSLVVAAVRRGENNPIWAINAVSAQPRHWTPGEIALVEEVTERTWAALERARAEAALRESRAALARELDDAKRLERVSGLLIQGGDGEALYESILDAAIAITGAGFGSMQLLDADRGELRLIAWRGFHPESAAYWQRVSVATGTSCGSALRRGERVVVPDVEAADALRGTEGLRHYRLSGIAAVQSTPLTTREGRLVGMVSTHWAEPHEPAERELRLLDLLARQAADFLDRRRVEDALRRSRDELEARVAERTADLDRLVEQLRAEARERQRSEAARTELLRRLATAEEGERRRVSRDLHDSVGQLLAGLSLGIKAVETAGPLSPPAATRLAEVQRTADALGKEVHGLAVRLRPTALDDLGLPAALGQLVGDWSDRTGVAADLQVAGLETGRLPPDTETTLYRVVQEALTNVARHAGATAVSVVVGRHDGTATAVVEDDGTGFDPDAVSPGRLGLLGMRERVALAGGELDIESAPGGGTTVIARVPAAHRRARA